MLLDYSRRGGGGGGGRPGRGASEEDAVILYFWEPFRSSSEVACRVPLKIHQMAGK